MALDLRTDLVDEAEQRRVCERLRASGIDARALIEDLREHEGVVALLDEVRAARREAEWRVIGPYSERLARLFAQLSAAMTRQGLQLPRGTDDAFVTLLGCLARPAYELDLHAVTDSPALAARRAEARRGPAGSATQRIKPMEWPAERSIGAIRHRLMPSIRRAVALRIQSALEAREVERATTPKRRPDTPGQIARRLNTPSYTLAAAFVRAFYPWFGAGTTAEHVRKALRRPSGRHPRGSIPDPSA